MSGVDEEAKKPARKLLLISYWYPPAVGAAAERIHSFAHYLPEHGWTAQVLTARHPAPDMAPGQPAPGIHAVPDPLASKAPAFADYDPRVTSPAYKTILRELVFPDRFVRWQRAAIKIAPEVVRCEQVQVLLASFPPASVVMLALRLSRETSVPLVLDFRDRWLGPGGYQPRLARTRRKHAGLEREAIRHAAGVVVVSDAMADAIVSEQKYDRARICVVPNGYEPVEEAMRLAAVVAPVSADHPGPSTLPITIAHVGTVIARNRPDLLFASLARLQARRGLHGVTFRFVGNLSSAYVRELGLSSVVRTTGLIPRDRAQVEMQTADALLLLTGSYVGQWGHNAKLFEYVQTGRPILCLEETPGSNDRELLERFAPDRAFFAPVGNPAAIAEQIGKLRQRVAAHHSPAIDLDDAFREFSRPNLAARLAEHLNTILRI